MKARGSKARASVHDPTASEAKVEALFRRNERKALSNAARRLMVNMLEVSHDGKSYKAWSEDRVVAVWEERELPGLGIWIFELIRDYVSLAIAANIRKEKSSAGGRKTVAKKRRSGTSKSDMILKALANQPTAETANIAERFQCDPSLVRKLRRQQGKG